MKKQPKKGAPLADRDTMRAEYDFSDGVRGATIARYGESANVVVIDPDVLDVFPDSASINEALRALAPMLRERSAVRPANKPTQRTARRAGRR
jgi:hypothetical protein